MGTILLPPTGKDSFSYHSPSASAPSTYCLQQHHMISTSKGYPSTQSIHSPNILLRSSSTHSNIDLTFPNNVYRHTCYSLRSVKQLEQYKQFKQYQRYQQCKPCQQYFKVKELLLDVLTDDVFGETVTLFLFFFACLGTESKNQNGNLRWHLP